MSQTLVAQDTGTVVAFIVKDTNGALVEDIASAVMRFRVGNDPVQEVAMQVDEPNSRVWYQFQKYENDPDPDTYDLTPGTLHVEVLVLDALGFELANVTPITFEVRDRL